jgi:hypothetical protein
MLPYDPVPWLVRQEGLSAVRARRILDIQHDGDDKTVRSLVKQFAADQEADGSFDGSLFKTAGRLNLLHDLRADGAEAIISLGAEYLFSVLQSQPGYTLAGGVLPGSLTTACDLCGFFGPYEARNEPEVMAQGAREMNYYRQYEPLMGPQSPVRTAPRSSYDRAGPSSCYAWGLIPLSYTIETLCRAGYTGDARLQPAVNALLGAQRESGGWCRNLGGHPGCTPHAIKALSVLPDLKESDISHRALSFIRGKLKGRSIFTVIQAAVAFNLPVARELILEELGKLVLKQRKNGTFGSPHSVERVTSVLVAFSTVQ